MAREKVKIWRFLCHSFHAEKGSRNCIILREVVCPWVHRGFLYIVYIFFVYVLMSRCPRALKFFLLDYLQGLLPTSEDN